MGSGHAVVLGASMSGLLAARTLADRYDQVTVVERDVLPAGPTHRRGIPQGRHFHTLLLRGARVLEDLFPGLIAELVAEGAPRPRLSLDTRMVLSGYEQAMVDTGTTAIQLTRPLLEGAVRRRVLDVPGIKIVDETTATRLHSTGPDRRVAGVHITSGDRTELLEADLVVDAMGRSGRTTAWLAELGYPAPAEDRIKIDLKYVSRLLRLTPGTPVPHLLTLVGPVPGRARGFALAAQEQDQWMLTVVGMAGDHPTDEGLLEFIEPMAPPEVYTAIRDAEPLSELRGHAFPASIRRRYEKLRRFPAGLLVMGDAICSFNPIYGQGMTVAAMQAEALAQCLQAGERDLARRFFRAAAKAVDPAWQLSANGDLALPEIEGHRPLATRLINRYIARLHRVGSRDTTVSAAITRVGVLLDPPAATLAPRLLIRALRPAAGRRTRRAGSPGPVRTARRR